MRVRVRVCNKTHKQNINNTTKYKQASPPSPSPSKFIINSNMSSNEEIINLLGRLNQNQNKNKTDDDSADNETTLNQLANLTKNGISEPLIMIILDKIFNDTLKITDKNKLLDECLIPNHDLSIDVFFKIISIIGVSRVYFKGNRKFKSKQLSISLQLKLLQWMIDNFQFLENTFCKSGSIVLTLLVKSLDYEFSRGPISQLIILLLNSLVLKSNQIITFYNQEIYHTINILKSNHIQTVVNLYNKFPLDIYLEELLAYFRVINPDLDYMIYSPENFPLLNKLNCNLNQVYRWKDSDELTATTITTTTTTTKSNKRQKTTITSKPDTITHNIEVLDQINKINPYKLVRNAFDNDKEAQLLTILFQTGNNRFINKVDKYIGAILTTFTNLEKELQSFLQQVSHLYKISDGTIILPLIENFILDNNNNNSLLVGKFCQQFDYRSKLIKYLHNVDPMRLVTMIHHNASILKQIYYDTNNGSYETNSNFNYESCHDYVKNILYLLNLWIFENQDDIIISRINLLLPELYEFIKYCKHIQEQLTNQVVEFFINLPSSLFNQLELKTIIIPRSLTYSCLLSCDPLVVSNITQHISNCKSHDYTNSTHYRDLQNSYIMDTINFLWKERFLKQDANLTNISSNKGFFLHPDFENKLNSLHTFDCSYYLSSSPSTIGEFFYNPAFSYIVTKIIWDIEDNHNGINTRHEGPISRESLIRLRNDSDKIWLSLSFDELKLSILQNLEIKKFNGIADLLFNSLKSLADKRSLDKNNESTNSSSS